MLWKASGNRVYLQKVNFYNNCPEIKADSDDEFKKKLKSKSSDFDILIYRSGTTAVQDERSFTIGRGINAGPIVLFERHALAEGQRETLGHELAHLIFGIADEYGEQGGGGVVTFYNAKERPPSEIFASIENSSEEGIARLLNQNSLEPRIDNKEVSRRGAWVFCSGHSFENPTSCIMDGDDLDYYDHMCGSEDHIKATVIRNLTSEKVEETAVLAKNGQHVRYRTSCQTTAAGVFRNRWGFDVNFSSARSGALPSTSYKEFDDCHNIAVLLMDKSGSMDGGLLDSVKRAAYAVIDGLDDENSSLGIIWFDTQARTGVTISELKNVRVAAKNAVASVEAGGGTRIAAGLGVAHEAIRRLRDPNVAPEDRGREVIILMTDGQSSDDTTAITNAIIEDGVQITTVALGDSVDHDVLFGMAARSGGDFFQAVGDEDAAFIVGQGIVQDLEGFVVVDNKTLTNEDDLTRIPLEVRNYSDKFQAQIQIKELNTSNLSLEDFQLEDPNGQALQDSILGTLRDGEATLVVKLMGAQTGTYTLVVPSSAVSSSTQIEWAELAQSNRLLVESFIVPNLDENGLVQPYRFPDPVAITAYGISELGVIQGMKVEAFVTRPDGSEVILPLLDNGNRFNGDEIRGDGDYTGLFRAFSGDGTYNVEIRFTSEGNAYGNAGPHSSIGESFGTLEVFQRSRFLSFQVSDFTSVSQGSIRITELGYEIPGSTIPYVEDFSFEASRQVVAGFRAEAGLDQDVVITELPISLNVDPKLQAGIKGFEFFHDSDEDGYVDVAGEFSEPLGSAVVDEFSDTITIQDGILVKAGQEVNILVTLILSVPETQPLSGYDFTFPLLGGFLTLGLMVPVLYFRRERFVQGLFVASLCLVGVMGCGQSESFVFSGPVNQPSDAAALETTLAQSQIRLRLGAIKAVGAIDEQPAQVTVENNLEVSGPELTIELLEI